MFETAGRSAAALSAAAVGDVSSKDNKGKVSQRDTGLAAVTGGVRLIRSNSYLSMIAAFLAMNYSVSSAVYFLRQVVAATGVSSSN